MRRRLARICGAAIVVCVMCVASSADVADSTARVRAVGQMKSATRMQNTMRTKGTQAKAYATEKCVTGRVVTQMRSSTEIQSAMDEGTENRARKTLPFAGNTPFLRQGKQDGAPDNAQTGGGELNLIPQAREVKEILPSSLPASGQAGQAGGAAFIVRRGTRIVTGSGIGGRSFEGAQMLADEIEQRTGWKLKISDAREMPGGSDIIYIGDATKDSKLRDALEKQGLSMGKGFDEQGYLIWANAHRILVGGASAEGAFNGVQTLRQLLRPAGSRSGNATANAGASGERVADAASSTPASFVVRQSGVEPPQSKEADSSESRRNLPGPLGMTNKKANAGGASEKKNGKRDERGGAKGGELNCPAVAIRDWPAMKWRGVSVDISRGPIPTLKFMENQIRVLAGFKLNMYALYMEDVFTVPGNEIFAPRDALTPDEIRDLVSYAQKYYVTIVPELETYGHLHNVLRYDVYSQLAEVPHGSVLTPTQPGSYDLLEKMIAAMAPIFKGPFFHIGADETFELGEGQTKELIAEKGLG
ncbi:MAG: family 20 glycosylhydrolase, partial [Candidatus Acidiferrales bacterium]